MSEQTVTVNGTVYDKRTGMPVRVERAVHNTARRNAQSIHQQQQHSRTLNRKYVKRETPVQVAVAPTVASTEKPKVMPRKAAPIAPKQVGRSESISRFAKQYNTAHKPANRGVINDFGPAPHAIQRNAHAKMAAKLPVQTTVKPSQIIKNEAIEKAMAALPDKRSIKQVRQHKQRKATRSLSLASAALAIILLGGYFTYLNMPQLSTRVAAAQAGINATYPNYQPMGYSLSGPVAYDQGSVSMKFAANAAPQSYTLNQTRSGWDSSAVLDNYVIPAAGDSYNTTTINGLTIYTYGNNAAWVNGGILYSISGNAMLSNEQVERIATSL